MKTLEDFLKTLSPDHKNAVEFRHKSWFCKEVYDLLSSYNAIFCILSAPELPSDIVVTGKFAYVRFHGVDSWYDYHYSQEELKEWAQQIKKLKTDTFAYFNNDVDAYAPYNALELGKMLKGLSLVKRLLSDDSLTTIAQLHSRINSVDSCQCPSMIRLCWRKLKI